MTHTIHSMGAAMINEKALLKNVSGGNVSTYADLIDEDEIRGEDKVYSFDGIKGQSSTRVKTLQPARISQNQSRISQDQSRISQSKHR
jgi:hypothetical protein